jgi:hypothetical protein
MLIGIRVPQTLTTQVGDCGESTDAGSDLAEWLSWARKQADRPVAVPRILAQLRGVNVAAKGDVYID